MPLMTVDMLNLERVQKGLEHQPPSVQAAFRRHMGQASPTAQRRAYDLLQRWAATGSHYGLAEALISAAVAKLDERDAAHVRDLVADLSPPEGVLSPRLAALTAAVASPTRPPSGWPARNDGPATVATPCPEQPTLILGDADEPARYEVSLVGWNDSDSVVVCGASDGRLRTLKPGEVIHEVRTSP